MLDDLDALSGKLAELASRVRQLRAENQDLRAQLAAASGELDQMRDRVSQAMSRIDSLLGQLPTPPSDGSARHVR
jgi:uncharacterized protein (TIGR02449 family)